MKRILDTRASWAIALLLAGLCTACSGGAGNDTSSPPPPSAPVVVRIAPTIASITTIQTQAFTATVLNSTNPAVTWQVDGIQGGNASVGVISAGGRYTPSPLAATHSITATSVEDPTKSSSATVTVKLIGVTVAPATASISTIQTQAFTATVVNGTNPAVTWQVDGVQGGNASVGTISAGGLYTPSPVAATHSITATSVEDPTQSGGATLTVKLIGVTVAPAAASISTVQTQAFTATVVNSTNPAVIWKVDGVQGGNATVGTISAAGLYTPSPVAATHSITATSVEDPTKSGSATVTVKLIAVTVTPTMALISALQPQQFTATVVNSTNPAVTWKVDGIQGGNATAGVISAAGLYTSPSLEATHSITAISIQDPTKSGGASVTVKLPLSQMLSGVLTYHNDNARTGQYLQETVLTPANVTSATFGKLFSFPVDGYVYAQPLYVSNVPVAGQLHNVAIVATEHNSVYAFDADNKTSAPLWQKSFIDPAHGITTVPSSDLPQNPNTLVPCGDITPEVGITSTPVIDPATGILYVVAKTKENGVPKYRIHALDITTGVDISGTGVEIQASVSTRTGQPDLVFDTQLENQRTALLLSNNVVYFGTGSYCDFGDHRGWFLGYDSKTLARVATFSSTPTGLEGGIWQSGGGAAADAGGNLYVITGDGIFDAAFGGNNYGDSILKFAGASLSVPSDYFTPFNQDVLQRGNADLGTGGALLLPDRPAGPPHLMVGAGKQGFVYLVNRDNMGGFLATGDSQIVQSFQGAACGNGSCPIFGTPAYFNDRVYIVVGQNRLKAYSFNIDGQLSLPPAQSTNTFPFLGATPAISANGSENGIVWVLQTGGSGAAALLHAYPAADVSTELYNSNEITGGRDNPGPAVKFTVPTIANGKVYVGAQGQLSVFGLLLP